MERSKGEAWSPLATVEEIQRRLVRPSSLRSQPPAPPASFWFSTTSLDPALLSVVSSKIGRQKKDVKMKKKKKEIEKFEWPVDELKVFVANSKMVKTVDWSSDEVIDLKDDNGID